MRSNVDVGSVGICRGLTKCMLCRYMWGINEM